MSKKDLKKKIPSRKCFFRMTQKFFSMKTLAFWSVKVQLSASDGIMVLDNILNSIKRGYLSQIIDRLRF